MGLRGGWKFFVPLNEPLCTVQVEYHYYDGRFIKTLFTYDSCSFSVPVVNVSLNKTLESGVVGNPYEIQCLVKAEGVNTSIVSISWTGRNGTFTNDSRLTITPNVSNGTDHISTLQFSYLSENDEGLYECSVDIHGLGTNISTQSTKLENITIPTPSVMVTVLNNQQVGDPLLLECNVTTVRGITSSVDIVWITNDEIVRRVNDISGETVDNSVVYSDTYNNGSILSEDNDGTKCQCFVIINSPTSVSATEYQILNLTIPTPNVTVTALDNQQVGDPLLLECNVTTVRGITSSVDIVWITNDTVKRVNNVSGETVGNYSVYRSIYNDSGILQDNNRTYQCSVNISVVSATDTFLYMVPVTTPTSTPGASPSTELPPQPTTESTSSDYSVAALIISAIIAAILVAITIVLLLVFIKKRELHLKFANGDNTDAVSGTAPSICANDYFSTIGREAPSTCEYIAAYEKVEGWLDDAHKLGQIKEERSTEDEMLKSVYGQSTKDSCYHSNSSFHDWSYVSDENSGNQVDLAFNQLTSENLVMMGKSNSDVTEQLRPEAEFENKDENSIGKTEMSSYYCGEEDRFGEEDQFDGEYAYVDSNVAKLQEHASSHNACADITGVQEHLQTVDNEIFQTTSEKDPFPYVGLVHGDKVGDVHLSINPQFVNNKITKISTDNSNDSSVDTASVDLLADTSNVETVETISESDCFEHIDANNASSVSLLENVIANTTHSTSTYHIEDTMQLNQLSNEFTAAININVDPFPYVEADTPILTSPNLPSDTNIDYIPQNENCHTLVEHNIDGKALVLLVTNLPPNEHCISASNSCTAGDACNEINVISLTHDNMSLSPTLSNGHYSTVMVGECCIIESATQQLHAYN
ncbi:uncharacterized protein [Dysidea avara]|uniref:uncharacterized protein n=1 Tax=Dysidea avara TaxID=196820 RepID=UPI003329C86E